MLAIADMNRDGRLDVVIANTGLASVVILQNNPDGGAWEKITLATGNAPTYVAIGDFNGDGLPDIAVSNHDDDTVGVLFNRCR
jgi:hypothetical protein